MIEKRAYLMEFGARKPKEQFLRKLIDRLAMCRYNELFLLRPAGVPERVADYARMKGIEVKSVEEIEALLRDSTVWVSTMAERSLAGRLEELRERMLAAALKAKAEKAKRFLVVDRSDGYDWQAPIVSLPGLVMGGYMASVGPSAAKMDLEHELGLFLDAPVAGHLLRLGTLYLRGGAVREDASEFFNILSSDCGYSRHPGLTDGVLAEVSTILRGMMTELERYAKRSLSARELLYTALLLDAACHRRSEARLRTIREEFARMWQANFEADGCLAAQARFPRF